MCHRHSARKTEKLEDTGDATLPTLRRETCLEEDIRRDLSWMPELSGMCETDAHAASYQAVQSRRSIFANCLCRLGGRRGSTTLSAWLSRPNARSTPASKRAICHCPFLINSTNRCQPFVLINTSLEVCFHPFLASVAPLSPLCELLLTVQLRSSPSALVRTAIRWRLGLSVSCLVRDVTYVSGQKAEVFL